MSHHYLEPVGWALDDPFMSFVGRERELAALDFQFQNGGVVGVMGSPGIGKTSLCKAYAAQFQREATGRLVRCRFPSDLHPSDVVAHFLDWQSALDHEVELVILDEIECINSAAAISNIVDVLSARENLRSIILSGRQVDKRICDSFIELDGLNSTELEFLLRTAPRWRNLASETSRILSRSHGNPLLMGLFADYWVEQGRVAFDQILEGGIYQLKGQIHIPETTLITSVRPALINMGSGLIERLKKNPDDVYKLSPRQFEELIADLLDGMGYDVELTPQANDGGKDILAYTNTPAGRILCLVEAKRYRADRPVSVSLVRELLGTLRDHNATHAMMVTSSYFSSDARKLEARHEYRLGLKEYDSLARWIQDHRN